MFCVVNLSKRFLNKTFLNVRERYLQGPFERKGLDVVIKLFEHLPREIVAIVKLR